MGIFDGLKKQEVKPEPEVKSDDAMFAEIGLTGLNRQGGYVYEEFLKELSGKKAVKVYKEMGENDAIVGAFLFVIDMFVRQVDWSVKPASENQVDIYASDFLEQCMHDMSTKWSSFISEVFTMVQFGWSWTEIVYKIRAGGNTSKFNDGLIGWRKFAPRAQESLEKWVFDEEGGVKAMVQRPAPSFLPRQIPIEKSMLFRTVSRKNNPEGKSLLRNAYRSWFFKKRIEEIEAIGLERDLAGYPVIGVPRAYLSKNATQEQRETVNVMKRIVTNIRRDKLEGLVRPIEYDDNGNELFPFTLMASGGKRNFETSEIINRYDTRIAMTVAADFLMLGHDKVGSFALSESKTNVFITAMAALLNEVRDVVNQHAVKNLFELNSFSIDELPRIEYSDIERIDLTIIVEALSKLTQAGSDIFPDTAIKNALLRRMGLPEQFDGEE